MSEALSDYNSKTGQRNQLSARTKLYSDLDFRFRMHPMRNDLTPLYDLDAIKGSIKNLILSSHNDRPFHPELGSNLGALLFELADTFTAISIKNEIIRVLSEFEPRIKSIVVQVVDNSDENAFNVTIGFAINGAANNREEVSFFLNRLR